MENAAIYKNLKRGHMISDGENFGMIKEAVFHMVLVNWATVNPAPLPPIYYPEDVWDFAFGGNYLIVKDAE